MKGYINTTKNNKLRKKVAMSWYNQKHKNMGFILKYQCCSRSKGFTVSTYLLVIAVDKWQALVGLLVADSYESVTEL